MSEAVAERVSETAGLLIRMSDGTCANKACRKPTKVFLGSIYCSECTDRLGGAMEARWKRDEIVTRCMADVLLSPITLKATFAGSDPKCEEQDAYARAKRWRPGETNAYIQGDIGSGKTYLGRCMLNAALHEEHSIGEITALELVKATTSGYQSRGVTWLYRPHVLLIDDIDKAPWNETTLGWLWQLLDRRRGLGYSTIITTNFPPNQLRDMLNERAAKNQSLATAIMDRLKPVTQIVLERTSIRGRQHSLSGFAPRSQPEELSPSEVAVLRQAIDDDDVPF